MSYNCCFCLHEDSLVLKYDKFNRPWVNCWACGTRAFLHSDQALKGLKLLIGLWPTIKEAEKSGAVNVLKDVCAQKEA